MCSQADDPSQHDDTLRAALIPIAARMARLEGGCESGHRAGQWHIHEGPFHAIARNLAVLAASATDEGGFCPDCGNVPGSQRWNRVHAASATEEPFPQCPECGHDRHLCGPCVCVSPEPGSSRAAVLAASATEEPTDD